jgi:hypothetical protein
VTPTTSFFQSPAAISLATELMLKLEKNNQLSLINDYRKSGVDPELLRFALNQAALKQRGAQKFGELATDLMFTEAGLEQATRLEVANWHARKFASAGITSITDLGAGIGADSIAFCQAGLITTSIENHPEAFLALEHNLRNYPDCKALNQDVEQAAIETQGVWLDPARRDQDRKSLTPQRLQPEMFSPNLDLVFEIATKHAAGVKLAPAFPHEMIPKDFEANWVSHSQDLVELTLWGAPLGSPGVKKAVLVAETVLEFEGVHQLAPIAKLSNFIFEPDVSLIRSHLIGAFANQHGLELIAENIAYLTSDVQLESPWLKSYRVIDVLPLDEKTIRTYCHKNQIGTLEIKKRGVDITPEQLRPKLKLKGAGTATLILTRVGSARQAIVCEPIR